MKQGTSNSQSGSRKQEPVSRAVDPGYAAQLGNVVGTRRAVETMYEGHGYKAPTGGGTTVHKGGSQGKR